MFDLVFFGIVFIIVYFVYYFIFDDLLKKEKYTKISELVILTKKFNLDKKKMNYRKLLNMISIINAFIIAFAITLVDILPDGWFIGIKLLIAFVVILILIFSLYFGYGHYLNKKWGKKDEK